MKSKKRPDFRGGGRYRHPQAWIGDVIDTDPALANLRLSCPPRFSPRLKVYGRAKSDRIMIGWKSLVSRLELIDTIIHEELHHRLWRRAQRSQERAWTIIKDLDVEEAYVERAVSRFLRRKGLIDED